MRKTQNSPILEEQDKSSEKHPSTIAMLKLCEDEFKETMPIMFTELKSMDADHTMII